MKQFTLNNLLGDQSPTARGELKIVHSTNVFWAWKNENIGDKVGNKKFWVGHVATDGVDWYTQTTFWQETSDGSESKRQTSAPTRVTQKNIGKANETSLEQQAYSELSSLVNKQRDKNYLLEGEESKKEALVLPMLAKKYEDRKGKVVFPVFAQPKFDGVRMVSNGKIMWSRKGKPAIQECVGHLMIDTQGHNIDGELILPAPHSFQDTLQAVKKYYPKMSPQLLHRVYDVVIPGMPFSERFEILKELVSSAPSHIVLAETVQIHSEEELVKYHEDKVAEGFEGVMVRSDLGGYEINKRANQLLKYKMFDDDEFEVIGVKTGRGKFEGLGILICATKYGEEFDAAPKGTVEFRKQIYDDPTLVVGKMWKVQYFGYTTTHEDPKKNVPRFPIAIAERDSDIEG